RPDRLATVVLLDRAVSHWDSFAKNAAARFKKSRSWVTRANSRFTRVNSSASVRWAARVVPWTSACRCWAVQRYNTFSEIPRSRATWATGWADSRTNRTASLLNSSVYRRRVLAGMVTSDFTILPRMEVSVKSGEGQTPQTDRSRHRHLVGPTSM